ncbi:MAG: GNAT family N-acetyltransferase [Promethearchaeota archaeon]
MEANFYDDINKFYNLASLFLLKREIENALILSILDVLKGNIHRYGEEMPLLLLLREESIIKLIAVRTPPHDLLISYIDKTDCIDVLVEELLKRNEKLPGVLSFRKAADKFTQLWCDKNSLESQLLRKERIYKLDKVSKETLGNNSFHVATKPYQSIVLKWAREMVSEALVEVTEEELDQNNSRFKIEFENNESQIFLLFHHDKPVSMARKAGKTPNGNAINLVYTPPPLRRRGYATECVAKLSKRLLDEGNKYCFLFTDLSNPTSNSIYLKIGYRPIIDQHHYKFMSLS